MSELLDMLLEEKALNEDVQAMKNRIASYDVYTVELKRDSRSRHFGFGYRVIQQDTGLILTVIIEDSAISHWNQSCDLVDTICVGDRITSINGKEDAKEMVKELKKSYEVQLKILKAGPRWHLDGATAECMRKIDWAMSKGLRFETRAVEDENAHAHQQSSAAAHRPVCVHYIMVMLVTMLPCFAQIFFFSDMSLGLRIYSMLSNTRYNMLGSGLVALASIYAVCLYVADWSTWTRPWQKYLAAVSCIYIYCFAFILKCRFYPFAPLIICLFHIVFFLGLLRVTCLRSLSRSSFYKSVWRICFLASVLLLGAWLIWMLTSVSGDPDNIYNDATKARLAKSSSDIYKNTKIKINGRERSVDYVWDCAAKVEKRNRLDFVMENNMRKATSYKLSTDEVDDRDKACADIKTIWFLMWLSPFVCFVTMLIIAVFAFLNAWDYPAEVTGGMEKMIKAAIACLVLIVTVVLVTNGVAAASMSLTSTLMAFAGTATVALLIWCYLEIGKRAITSSIKESKVMQMLIMAATSDAVRAFIVVAFGALAPVGLALSWLNQKVRKLRGKATSNAALTDGAQRIMRSLAFWNWGKIFIYVNYIVWIYWFFTIGALKWTYVFLSWLNVQLLDVDLGVVIIIFFVVGLTMFLLPPVPGVPVYIAAGVVIAARASATPVGFGWGIVIACIVSWILKLIACAGQYMIGFFLGQSVKVQQLCMVDKPLMRSVEKILLARGFTKAKVSCLLGGPDWPTSVICGILKLNLVQILLGTTPVVFVSSPCVLAGAFLAGPVSTDDDGSGESDDSGLYTTLASGLLATSLALQAGIMALAGYYFQDTLARHGPELNRYRPEHAPVMELTAKEAEWVAAWQDVLQWKALSMVERVIILVSVGSSLLSMFLFAFLSEMCYRSFQVSARIEWSFGRGGLNNNALNIMLPLGWAANGLFFFGMIVHFVFVRIKTCQVPARLKYKRENPGSTKNSKAKSIVNKPPPSQRKAPNTSFADGGGDTGAGAGI